MKKFIQPNIPISIMEQAQETFKKSKGLIQKQSPTKTTVEILLQYIEDNKEDEK